MKRLYLCISLLCWAIASQAYEIRPIYLELTEIKPNVFHLIWKAPDSQLIQGELQPVLPENCSKDNSGFRKRHAAAIIHQQQMNCPRGIHGGKLSITDLDKNIGVSVFTHIKLLNGEHYSKMLSSTNTHWIIPHPIAKNHLYLDYAKHGFTSMLAYSHLIFLLCMVLLYSNKRKLAYGTLGYSLACLSTLWLTCYSVIALPITAINILVALTVIYVAAEVIKSNNTSMLSRSPFIMMFCFGTTHGVALAQAIPMLVNTSLSARLTAFSMGTQLTLLGVIFAAHLLIPKLKTTKIPQIASYLFGTTAAFWIIHTVI